MTRTAVPERDAVVDGFVTVLCEKGIETIPEAYRKPTVREAMKRIEDPLTGFWFFWLWLAWVQIKGRGAGTGFQRACPGGQPRADEVTGKTWAWQAEVAKAVTQFPILLILKARQIGFTWLMANFVVWAAISGNDQIIAVIANKLQSAKRILRRAKQVYDRLPNWLKAEVRMTSTGITRLEFSNGSTVEPYSGDPDAARSEAASWVIVDEIGEIERLVDFWSATESVADGGGSIVMFGTAKDNGLEDWCRDGASGDVALELAVTGVSDNVVHLPVHDGLNGMGFLFVPWYVHPGRNEEWVAKRLRTYKGNVRKFQREYPTTWEDAFQATGLAFFNANALQKTEEELSAFVGDTNLALHEYRDRVGTLVVDPFDSTRVRFVEDPLGHVTIHASAEEFAELLEAQRLSRRPIVIPADCAGDKPEGDYHAASAIFVGNVPMHEGVEIPEDEIVPYRQLVTIHGHMDGDYYAELLCRLGHFLDKAMLAPEVNGIGSAVIKTVRRLRYPNIYTRRTDATKKGDKQTRDYGWHSNSQTKPVAYGEAERLLRNGWLEIRDIETIREMKSIVNKGRSKIEARSGKHDDRADAVAIGCGVAEYARTYSGAFRYGAKAMPDPLSPEAVRQRLRAARQADQGVLGSENRHILAG